MHTPGPWAVHNGNNMPASGVYLNRDIPSGAVAIVHLICSMTPWNITDVSESERIANARLIAAAPELLEACKALFFADHHEHFAARMSDSELAAIERIRAAVAKATDLTVVEAE